MRRTRVVFAPSVRLCLRPVRSTEQPVTRLAIACFTDGHFTKEPGSPCGACRQVMIETEHRYGEKMEVLLYGEDATWVFESAADLLPLIFVSENLKG